MNTSSSSRGLLPLRLFVMMALEFFVWGAWLPLIWQYMAGLGFTGAQMAWVGSAFAIASIFAIFAGNQFVDRRFSAERFMAASHLVGGLAMLGLFYARDFRWFFVLMLVHLICYVPTISVANSIALSHLQDPRRQFGLVRMGGTIGWAAASWPLYFHLRGLHGEALQRALGGIFVMAAAASLLLAVFSLALPRTPPRAKGARADEPFAWREALRHLFRSPFLTALFVVTFIDSTVHNAYFLLMGGFLAQRGVAPENIMPVMSIGQVAEILSMAGLGLFLQKAGWKLTMAVGIFGQVCRYLVFSYFGSSLAAIVAVQVLHGICYAFFFATLYVFVAAAFPKDVGTSAQGLFNFLILGVGDLAAKWAFIPLQMRLTHEGRVDFHRLFLVPAGLAVAAALIFLAAFRPPASLGAPGAGLAESGVKA